MQLEARAILGLLMTHPELANDAGDLTADLFGGEDQEVYKAMSVLVDRGQPIDMVALMDVNPGLRFEYLAEVYDTIVSKESWPFHKKALKKAYARQVIARLADDIPRRLEEEDANDLVGDVVERLSALTVTDESSPRHISDILDTVYGRIQDRLTGKALPEGPSSPWAVLTSYITTFTPGRLYYVAARPGMGKTSILLQLASHSAKQDHPVVFFSLEMSSEDIITRLISQEGGLDNVELQTGVMKLTRGEEYQEERRIAEFSDTVVKTIKGLQNRPIIVIDTPALTLQQIKAISRQIKRKYGKLGMVVVDYLTYMGGTDENNRLLVEKNSKGLKALAKELKTAVVSAAQLSRASEARPDKRPVLSDLRETGGIEQDADVVMMLYRPEYYDPGLTGEPAELILRKNRHGPTGTVLLEWVPNVTMYKPYKQKEEDDFGYKRTGVERKSGKDSRTENPAYWDTDS